MTDRYLNYAVRVGLLFGVYFATARLGLSLDAVSGFATLVWPPTGIALAAILLLGYRYWPGILLAALLVNIVMGAPTGVALGIASGNTLEALGGAYLLRRFCHFEPALERLRDVLSLVIVAAFFSTLISATLGATSLLLGDVISTESYGATWLAWWVGDMLGNLVVAPVLLVWSSRAYTTLKQHIKTEALLLTSILVLVAIFVFQGVFRFGIAPLSITYLIFPLLIWIALRFGQPGGVMAIFILSAIAVWSTVAGVGPFSEAELSYSLLQLQSFMGITAITFMTMAAMVSEREQTLKHQQRLLHRTAQLTKQRARLLALNKTKDEFISLASHQLRTPATGVKQYVGMLLQNYQGKLSKAQRGILELAYTANERQIQIINALLNVAQIDAGKVALDRRTFDLVPVIKNIVTSHKVNFTRHQQKVNFVHPKGRCMVNADKEKLTMVLENIIDNASKYSAEGKPIEITLHKTPAAIIITVKDEGVGIHKQDLAKLFKKFSRLDSPLMVSAGGSGLGLYWSKKIIAMHQGSIAVTSQLGKGSTFTITLPVSRSKNR